MSFRYAFPLAALLAGLAAPASAHVVLSQPIFEAGQNYAAFFKIEHGCNGSPTIALRVQIPDGVTVLDTPAKPGWTLTGERTQGRVSAVTWRGQLDAKTADQFGLLLKLPAGEGPLYFPAVQQCEKGEMSWTETPAAGRPWGDLKRPAVKLQLTAAKTPPSYMAGSIMIEQPWSAATPGGATTAGVYATIMNHGDTADTLLGGTSPVAGKFEIHQMTKTDGVISMRTVSGGIAIPPGALVNLGPLAAYHVMLSGLKGPLKTGTHIPATLNFAKAGNVQVQIEIEPIGSRGPAGAGAMPGMAHP